MGNCGVRDKDWRINKGLSLVPILKLNMGLNFHLSLTFYTFHDQIGLCIIYIGKKTPMHALKYYLNDLVTNMCQWIIVNHNYMRLIMKSKTPSNAQNNESFLLV